MTVIAPSWLFTVHGADEWKPAKAGFAGSMKKSPTAGCTWQACCFWRFSR